MVSVQQSKNTKIGLPCYYRNSKTLVHEKTGVYVSDMVRYMVDMFNKYQMDY